MPLFERSSGILRILAYYLTFAIIWILVSDQLVHWALTDPAQHAKLQSYKGIIFVILTTAFLGLILTREHQRTLRALAVATENEQRVKQLIDTSLARAKDHIHAAELGTPPAPFDWDIASGALVLGEGARVTLNLDATEPYLTLDDWLTRVYEDDRGYVAKALNAFLSGESLELSLRYRHQTSAGDYRWIQTYGRLVRHPDGTPWRVLGTHCEITRVKRLETELSQLTATLRLFIDHAPAAVAMFDREFRYLSASQRYLHDFDLTSDILGKCHYEVFPHLPLAWRDEHQRALAGEVVRSSDNHALDLHGRERWFNRELRPWHDPDGNIGGIVVFIDETSERKRLLNHLTLYSSVFLQAQEAITITDHNARILDVNDAFTKVTGYSREEVLGENPRILQSGEHDDAFYERMWSDLREKGRWYGEIRNRRKDGSVYPEFLTISAVRDDHGEIAHYVAHFFDISAQKQTEEALRSTEASLKTITDSMQDMVFTLDSEQRHTALFGPWVAKAGITDSLLLGKTAAEILGPDGGAVHKAANERALAGEFTVYEWTLQAATGQRSIQTSLSPIHGPDGEVVGIVGVGRDITDLKQAEQRTLEQLERLSALRSIESAISGSVDLSITLKIVLGEMIKQLGVQAAAVLLLNPHSQILAYVAGQGFKSRAIERSRVKLGEGVSGAALLERRRLRQRNPLQSLYFHRTELLEGESFQDYYAVPMVAKGHQIGVLEVYLQDDKDRSESWLEFLDMLADLAAIAVDNARLFGELQRSHLDVVLAYDATIEGWSKALDLRDKETEGHTQRVTELTERLARAAGVSDEDLVQMRRGALLHDIGKMGVPDSILLKEGPLTDDERAIIQTHPDLAYQMLSPIEFLRPALDIPYAHHERWDGTGYPRGLKGLEIPLSARLFALVDVWDALRSDRPYRKAWPRERVLEHIRAGSGTHFDPQAVETFMSLMEREGDEIEITLGYDKMSA